MKRKKPPRSSGNGGSSDTGRGRPWEPDKLYHFRTAQLALVRELDRLFPDRAPLLDLDALAPGSESVETVSAVLLEDFRRHGEPQVFLVFGKLNAERVLDYIDHRLAQNGWPLLPNEILAETYARLFRARITGRMTGGFRGLHPTAPVWNLLCQRVEEVITEQMAELRSMSLPLPGLPLPATDEGERARAICAELLEKREIELEEAEARRWAVCAMMRLSALSRRVLLARDVHDMEWDEIATVVDRTPFEVVRIAKDAEDQIALELRAIAEAFVPSGESEDLPEGTVEEEGDAERSGEEDDDG